MKQWVNFSSNCLQHLMVATAAVRWLQLLCVACNDLPWCAMMGCSFYCWCLPVCVCVLISPYLRLQWDWRYSNFRCHFFLSHSSWLLKSLSAWTKRNAKRKNINCSKQHMTNHWHHWNDSDETHKLFFMWGDNIWESDLKLPGIVTFIGLCKAATLIHLCKAPGLDSSLQISVLFALRVWFFLQLVESRLFLLQARQQVLGNCRKCRILCLQVLVRVRHLLQKKLDTITASI